MKNYIIFANAIKTNLQLTYKQIRADHTSKIVKIILSLNLILSSIAASITIFRCISHSNQRFSPSASSITRWWPLFFIIAVLFKCLAAFLCSSVVKGSLPKHSFRRVFILMILFSFEAAGSCCYWPQIMFF